jgi:SAM-dependent methyltransferase
VSEIKLNIGAGPTVIEGFTPIDRKFGTEAFPLNYPDDSVSEIRCSHLLEHLSFAEVPQALEEWRRVLKPGGRLRIAVPDARKIIESIDDSEKWAYYLMGGQTDGNDFHKSVYDERRLAAYLHQAGLVGINRWESPNTDTAAHPMSLNLEAFKPEAHMPESMTIKIKGVMSVPRIGWNDAGSAIDAALRPFGIHCERFNGVFWGQCMQRAFQHAIDEGVDWILTLDYDSMPTAEHLDHMLGVMGARPDIDALAPLQMRRGHDFPLMTQAGKTEIEITGEPIKVHTAHFGMTLLRADALKDIPKPWFVSKPDANGDWGDDRQDDDIWFWHQWRLAGKTVYVDPEARIGHLELMVSEFDDDMQPQHTPIGDWWDRNRKKRS